MKKILLLFFLLNASSAFAQAPQDKIFWQEDGVLTWDDFKAEPNPAHPYEAMTSSGISYSWSLRTSPFGKKDFISTVESYFSPSESWVKKGKRSSSLLKHEQLHFDITELHARKLRKIISEYKLTPNIKGDLQNIFNSIHKERIEMQNLYDRETSHGTDTVNQKKWEEKVKFQMEKLKEFASD